MTICPKSKFPAEVMWMPMAFIMLAATSSGCIYGSLATDTGVSTEGVWSVAEIQDAHVGETVKYSFILREPFKEERLLLWELADYAALSIMNDRVEAVPNLESRFELAHTLDDAEPGRTLSVMAEAFKIRGRRDYMKIRDKWLRAQGPNEENDKRVARDIVKLRVYQSEINYSFEQPRAELDWSAARLVISRGDGKVSTVFMEQPLRPGFTKNGPDRRGRYHIQYLPTADQINKTGQTSAALYVLDVNGQQHVYKFKFDTP